MLTATATTAIILTATATRQKMIKNSNSTMALMYRFCIVALIDYIKWAHFRLGELSHPCPPIC